MTEAAGGERYGRIWRSPLPFAVKVFGTARGEGRVWPDRPGSAEFAPLVEPNRDDRRFARGMHREFASRPGAEHIASRRALALLAACLRTFEPRRVLDLGAGIGSTTTAMLAHPVGVERVVSTEDNEFCLAALHADTRLTGDPRWTLVSSPEALAELDFGADLVVCDDSGMGVAHAVGVRDRAETGPARSGSLLFFEGSRRREQQVFRSQLLDRGLDMTMREHGLRLLPEKVYPGVKVRRYGPLPQVRIRLVLWSKGCWIGRVHPSLDGAG